MNKKQKTCLLVSMATMVVMGLFPPWVIERRVGGNKYVTEPGPYSWIGNPPVIAAETKTVRHPAFFPVRDPGDSDYVWGLRKLGETTKERYTTTTILSEGRPRFIDLYRLGVQYFIVAVVTAGLVITFRDEKATKQ